MSQPAAHVARDAPEQTRPTWPPVVDVLLAAGLIGLFLLAAAHAESDRDGRSIDWLGAALIVLAGSTIAWRRVVPEIALVASTTLVTLYTLLDYEGGPVYLTPLICIYTITTLEGRRRSIPLAAGATAIVITAGFIQGSSEDQLLIHALYISWAVAVVLLGQSVHSRRQYLAGLEERARYLEETRDEEARRRVAEERLRIARDLHDVVAHSLASISIQSGAGAHVIDQDPDQARESLLAIKRASREALDELRATLATLRESDETAPRTPAPGLGDLHSLVAGAERSGIPVGVAVKGAVRTLPPSIDLTAYRIVQESLTNVMRHAAPARATVSVTYKSGQVEVEVTDDGPGATSLESGGHGIEGMRERAAMAGGRLEVGPCPEGGFRVRAVLPVEPVAP